MTKKEKPPFAVGASRKPVLHGLDAEAAHGEHYTPASGDTNRLRNLLAGPAAPFSRSPSSASLGNKAEVVPLCSSAHMERLR
jgi:hypothetical protein